jgi:hypothetical protein
MQLTIYGVRDYPHDFLVTKVSAPLEQCAFLLDFGRKLERIRWFFGRNKWFGFTLALGVPVVHLGESKGGYVFVIRRGEPYFTEIPKLWKQHSGTSSSRTMTESDGLEVIADFVKHFPNDCS